MLGRLIKLAVVALILHGAWRAGSAYWVFYRFEDGLQEIAQFGGNSSDGELRTRVGKLAGDLEVPVSPAAVDIRRTQARLFIDATYGTEIQLLPSKPFPWTFKASVSAWIRP